MNNVVNPEKSNDFKTVIKGYLYSICISIILLFIYAVVLVNTGVKETTISTVITIITSISILIGSSFSCMRIKKNGIVNGLCIGGIYILTLYLLSSITITGFTVNLKSLIVILGGVIFGGIGGIIGVNVKRWR